MYLIRLYIPYVGSLSGVIPCLCLIYFVLTITQCPCQRCYRLWWLSHLFGFECWLLGSTHFNGVHMVLAFCVWMSLKNWLWTSSGNNQALILCLGFDCGLGFGSRVVIWDFDLNLGLWLRDFDEYEIMIWDFDLNLILQFGILIWIWNFDLGGYFIFEIVILFIYDEFLLFVKEIWSLIKKIEQFNKKKM